MPQLRIIALTITDVHWPMCRWGNSAVR